MANDIPPYYVTDTVRVEIDFFMANNNAANVFHVGYDTPPAVVELNALAGAITDWLGDSWAPLASQDWEAVAVKTTDLGGPEGKRLNAPIVPSVVGTDITEAMPANVTIAVKADTGLRGRGRSGRIFWIGLAEDQVDQNTVDVAARTGILAALESLNAAIAALDNFTGMVVPHSFETIDGVQVHLNPATSNAVESFSLSDNLIDSQKDRLPFHKKHRKPRAITT